MFRAIGRTILNFIYFISYFYIIGALAIFLIPPDNPVYAVLGLDRLFRQSGEQLAIQLIGLFFILMHILRFVFFFRCSDCKKLFSMRKGYPKHIGDVMEERDEPYGKGTYSRREMEVKYTCKHCGFWKSYIKLGKAHRIY